MTKASGRRLPDWLKVRPGGGTAYTSMKRLTKDDMLHTICVSGKCPNLGECWQAGHATFMILGDICTRSCKFCGTKSGKPLPPDPDEAGRLALTIKKLGLKHCILTSVDRDDLEDFGAAVWVETISKIREINPSLSMETLIPDFQGRHDLLGKILKAKPDIISHNLETVRRLTPKVRSAASYNRSLDVLSYLLSAGALTKSGIMLGLGETEEEILETMDDLLETGCRILTLGQYLQPGAQQLEVVSFITPQTFDKYRETGLAKGFDIVESGPLVRTSYKAHHHVGLASKASRQKSPEK